MAFTLLWLAGVALRITMLAVPPVLPLIHDDLHLSETMVGALNGLPVLLLGVAAVTGSLLLARFGAINALIVGLLLTAAGGALRGVGPAVGVLFAMTFVMGVGIAIMQPAMPTLAGRWFPGRVGFATAVYVNGLICGEIASAALTIPLVLPLVGGSWEWSFGVWSLPVAFTTAVVILAQRMGFVRRLGHRGSPRPLWWPDWRNGTMWCIGAILGCNSSIYFGANAFIPDYMLAIDRLDLVGPALTALNATQLLASALLLGLPHLFVGRRWPLALTGALGGLAVAALLLSTSAVWIVVMAGLIGCMAASNLILTLSLPPLLAPEDDVHRFAAGQLAIGYVLAFVAPVVSGAVWDATHAPELAFLTIAATGGLIVILATMMPEPRRKA